ncbi:Mitochondrial glycine transporter [Mycena chlorophos]|uniref:Mitochondrial glycine transporter n=1 Tax=Mycena chlorophos TaxID=658473 RepID=A0A8H6T7A2_MYCCL|nr:Mitochondrial glycine transporter [Mycena chlorophos]
MSNIKQQLGSGALSGFASTVFLQPFDLLKTRLQQGDGTLVKRNTATLFQTSRQIVASQGLAGLWRGTNASLIRNVPGISLYLTGLTQLRTAMAGSAYFSAPGRTESARNTSVLPKLSSQGNLIAGASTRVAVGFLLNPFSVLKARYEACSPSNMYSYTSLSSAFLSIARSGPTELFRGFLASSLRDAPYAGLFVVVYEAVKKHSGKPRFPYVTRVLTMFYLPSICIPSTIRRTVDIHTHDEWGSGWSGSYGVYTSIRRNQDEGSSAYRKSIPRLFPNGTNDLGSTGYRGLLRWSLFATVAQSLEFSHWLGGVRERTCIHADFIIDENTSAQWICFRLTSHRQHVIAGTQPPNHAPDAP